MADNQQPEQKPTKEGRTLLLKGALKELKHLNAQADPRLIEKENILQYMLDHQKSIDDKVKEILDLL